VRRFLRAAPLWLNIVTTGGAAADPGVTLLDVPAPGQHAAFAGQTHAGAPSDPSEYRMETVATGLNRPWSVAFLPDDKLLVSERPGRLRVVDVNGAISAPVTGLPDIRNGALGGLLDVALDPGFAGNGLVYFSYLEPRGALSGVAVARGRLDWQGATPGLSDVITIFRAEPAMENEANLGSRLMFGRDGMLYVALGDRFARDQAQSLASHLGKIIRITPEGGVPPDNPFVGVKGALPEIYAIGMRNPEGLAMDAAGRLWEVENGPKGGDEVNPVRKGANYGWPVITYGRDYDDKPIGAGTAHAGMEQPVYYWDPSIAPSGAAVYDGALFPDWNGDLFVAALKGQHLSRLVIRGGKVLAEEEMLGELKARIRDVREGPDGALYVLTDEENGRIVKVTPSLLVSRMGQPVLK
jgi:glucose/arabinose dehydrogenase